ncbi:MAG: hypothetical protein CM15mP18_3100 [Methanobacteriota archaeon]|nr:MAG: hypothetical protein CM15mP18_3100 [Euryarchaeota archaeon]
MWTRLVQDRTIVLVEHEGIHLAAFGAELVDAAQAGRMRFSRIGQQEGAGPRGGVVQQGQHALLVSHVNASMPLPVRRAILAASSR